jgi:hypothetical protein
VATDQKTSPLQYDTETVDSPIENELPSYRAISTRAIFSLVLGALAICCFANPVFYGSAILAVVLGIAAHRAIRRYPDMLTGHGLANAGIALGLVFGLSCATYTGVQYFIRMRLAQDFAHKYEAVLKSNSLADMLFYNTHPEGRKDRSGEEMLKQFEASKPREKKMMEQKIGSMIALNNRLKSTKDQEVDFLTIEGLGVDDRSVGEMPVYALAIYKVHGPPTKEFPEKEQYVLAMLKGRSKGKQQYDWWVDEVRFPYKPQSYEPPIPTTDDGHGHAH